MSKFLLKSVKVMVAGVELTGHAFNVDTPSEKEQVDMSGFSAAGTREYLPGLEDQTLEVQFLQDFGGTQVHATLEPLYAGGSTFVVYVVPDTNASVSATNPAYGGSANLYSYNGLSGALGARAEMTATFRPAPNNRFVWGTAAPT